MRAWTFKRGMKAPQAAGIIHSDFEKKFIRAVTMSYDDLVKYGSEKGCKRSRTLREEGKRYVVKMGTSWNSVLMYKELKDVKDLEASPF